MDGGAVMRGCGCGVGGILGGVWSELGFESEAGLDYIGACL